MPTRTYLEAVQRGDVPGAEIVHKFGRNDAVPNVGWAFVNLLGFTGWPLSAATTVRVKAGNGADTAAGNGAREITFQGIDSNGDETTEVLATAGASASSNSTASFWRVHRAWVSSCGTYGAANTAAVVIENSGGGTDLIQIAIEEGQTQFAGWTVPTGKTAKLISFSVDVDSKKSANVRVFTRGDIMDASSAPFKSKRIRMFFDGLQGTDNIHPKSPLFTAPALTDIWAEAYGDGAISQVSVDFELLIEDA
jgi:hypothetical protein